MMTSLERAWFSDRTATAPGKLLERAAEFAEAAQGESMVVRLAAGGESALDAAMAAGENRGAALDLLAADALITLALLAQAEADPAALGATARALRDRAVP